ncbi:amidase [Lichenifustis flavocetrariae]|uniref:Indoleacetamide hydrolase n=1 Tax=Lichenifustis flavocetrariae TaxID=2949735 RepID=A0AA41Z235_9HYPH|nr:amidase [Lichenifustis flavocetrariae]MCW6511443.1 amidase [Lichenifustis flavocetrariae]
MDNLQWMSAAALGDAFRSGHLSPVEALEATLKRIAAIDPLVNAFVHCDAAGAVQAAQEAERDLRAGLDRGPLQGIPVGIKDIIDVAGLPCTCHSKILRDHVAASDAAAVAALRRAGAIIVGKLATHEFALGGPSFDLPFPPARNPWNRERHPGGSSSGAGAGLAAGLFPLALGTDTGGSIRNPASACGVVGLKPTYGLVSREGVFPLAPTLDHVGPMGRTVADVAAMLAVLAGHRPAGPHGGSSKGKHGDVRGFRIGYVRHFHERDMPAHPDVAAALDEVAAALAREGALIEEVTLPALNGFSSVNRILLQAEAWTIHARWLRERPEDYAESTRRRLLAGAFLTAEDYVLAQRRRRTLIEAVEAVMGTVDVLLTASAMDPPCRIDDAAEMARTYPRQARTPFNVTGHPALAMMAGLSSDGLPLSVQFVARYHAEATLLAIAAAWERIGGWQDWHPAALA